MVNTENAVPPKRKENGESRGGLLEGGVTTDIRRSAIYGRKKNDALKSKKFLASLILIEPPYTEPYARWCERTEVNHLLLLDYTCERAAKSVQFYDLYASKEERRNKRRICFLGSGAKTKEKENEKMGSDVILYD
ncbi:hypothetical protein B379_13775 [Anoxybacillus ayderensis G10]|nr:hypothetical protein B379_13775 [Anoxybacillus ayderensis G10]